MKQLFIDDIRDPSQYYSTEFYVARDYHQAVNYVKGNGIPDFISFDHDLGDLSTDEKTGYSFAKFIINYMIDNDCFKQFEYVVHSANPVGKKNIEMYLDNAFSFIK